MTLIHGVNADGRLERLRPNLLIPVFSIAFNSVVTTMKRFAAIMLFAASSIAYAAMCECPCDTQCGVADCQIITPGSAPAPSLTAGQGIVQAAVWNEGVWMASKRRQVSVAQSYNSLSSVREFRFRWSMIEPSPGQYAWDDVKKAIDQAWNDTPRKQSIIRISAFTPVAAQMSLTPEWFISEAKQRGPKCTSMGPAPNFTGLPAGCTWYEVKADSNSGTLFAYNPNESARGGYQDKMLAMIESFRNAVDTPEYRHKLLSVDIGLMGRYGEMETTGTTLAGSGQPWPMSNATNAKAIVDAWWMLSPRIQVTSNFQFTFETGEVNTSKRRTERKTGWEYVCQKAVDTDRLAGWRSDGIDKPGISGTGWVILPALKSSFVLADCWKTGSVNGEPMAQWSANDNGNMLGALEWWGGSMPYLYKGNEYPAIRGTMFNAKHTKLTSFAQDQQEALKKWPTTTGYQLRVSSVALPKKAKASDEWNVAIEVENVGNNPFLLDGYELKLVAKKASGQSVTFSTPAKLFKLGSKQKLTESKTGLSLPEGQWSLEVGLGPAAGISAVSPVYMATALPSQSTPDGTQLYKVGYIEVQP